MGKRDIPWAEANETAQALVALFGPVCERIEIVGSVRRKKPIVHDVELLLEPKTRTEVVDLFGTTETVSLFEQLYAEVPQSGAIVPIMGGSRLKRFTFRDTQCELFVMFSPSQWGMGMVIRTGPSDFSHRLVTPKSQGGWLPDGCRVHDLGIYHAISGLIETPTEESVFDAIGRPYQEPGART